MRLARTRRWARFLALPLAAAASAGCGGGGDGDGSSSGGSGVANVCQPTAALSAGLQMEAVMAITPGGSSIDSTGTVVGPTIFHGHSAVDVEIKVSSSDLHGFMSWDSAAKTLTSYGATLHGVSADGNTVFDSESVATPPAVDPRYGLAPGQSATVMVTSRETATATINGVKQPPQTTTDTTTTTIEYVGMETVTTPAGTFTTCKYVETVEGAERTNWQMAGYGTTVKSISGGTTTTLQSFSVDGKAVTHFP